MTATTRRIPAFVADCDSTKKGNREQEGAKGTKETEIYEGNEGIMTIRQFDRLTAGDASFGLAPLDIARDGHGRHGRRE